MGVVGEQVCVRGPDEMVYCICRGCRLQSLMFNVVAPVLRALLEAQYISSRYFFYTTVSSILDRDAVVSPFALPRFTRRRKDESIATHERLDATRKGRGEEGLAKIRGPEWGITELDFEGDYNAYQNQEMKREYDGAGKGIKPTAYRASHRPGQQSVSAQAWMQEVSAKQSGVSESDDPWHRRSYSLQRFLKCILIRS